MPITVVGTAGNSAIDDANVTVTLPGGMMEDDLVVVIGGFTQISSSTPGPTTGGYTSIASVSTGSKTSAHYKFMSSSPDASVTCQGGTFSGVLASAYVVTVLRGVHLITPLNVAATTAFNNTTNPDPPSITTSRGGCMIVVGAVSGVFDTTVTAPSGYTDFVQAQGSDSVSATAALASFLQTTGGVENPPAFTNWSSGGWGAITIAFDDATAPDVNPRSFGVVMA